MIHSPAESPPPRLSWVAVAGMMVVWKWLAALLLVAGMAPGALAASEAEICEMDCKEQCRVTHLFGNYVDNICYNSCLSEEHVCRAGIPAIAAACRSMSYYQQALIAVREARDRGAIPSKAACMDTNTLAAAVGEVLGDSDAVGKIVDSCGCFVCDEAFSSRPADVPPPKPAPQPQDACESVAARLAQVRRQFVPCSQTHPKYSGGWNRCMDNERNRQRWRQALLDESGQLGCYFDEDFMRWVLEGEGGGYIR